MQQKPNRRWCGLEADVFEMCQMVFLIFNHDIDGRMASLSAENGFAKDLNFHILIPKIFVSERQIA